MQFDVFLDITNNINASKAWTWNMIRIAYEFIDNCDKPSHEFEWRIWVFLRKLKELTSNK